MEKKFLLTEDKLDLVPKGRDSVEKVLAVVKEHNLDAKLYCHPESPIVSLQSHLDLYGGTAAEVLKCLCMVSKGRPLVVMASGEIKIDTNKLQKISSMKDIRMARLEELQPLFGRAPGGVDALTVPDEIPLFADKRLFEKEVVVGSAGSPYVGLKLNPKEILKIKKPVIEDLAKV